MADPLEIYRNKKGLTREQAVAELESLNKGFKSLYETGTFDLGDDDEKKAHDLMAAEFKKDPELLRAFDTWRTSNGFDSVQDTLKSANNTMFVGDAVRGAYDFFTGGSEQDTYEKNLLEPYGYSKEATGGYAPPYQKEQAKKEAQNVFEDNAPATDAEVKAAVEEAAVEAKTAAPKTLEQPEGGAAPAGVSNTPANQTQANLQAKINSMPEDVDLGTGGATKKNRSRMNLQAEADRQVAEIIKQQKKASDQNNFLRDRYDATGGRGVGAFDALSPDAKAQAIKNYRENSFFDSSTQAGQDREELFAENNPNYTPPKADIQSQYEAASMNPPSVANPAGTATTAEFGSMNPAQQRAFIQNYRYKPQGQSPETVQEGLIGNAMVAPNPLDNIGTTTLTPFMTEEEQDDIVTQSLGSPKTENLSPFIPGSFPNSQPVTAAEKQSVLPPALRQQSEPEAPIGSQRDPSQGLLNLSNPSQVSPPQDFANEIVKSLPNPIPQKANEFDVSKLPVLEEVQTTENEIPDFSNVPSTAPAPAPALQSGLTRPQGMPPREEGFEEFLKPDPPQAKPQGQSPVYGKKPDGTYGITGYRNLADMKTGAYTRTRANNERRADQQKRARSGEMSNPFADLGSTYNRYADGNEDAFAKRRAQQAELAKKAARQRELAKMPTPRADAGMDLMNSLPMNQQVGIVNQFRKKRGEQEIFNPYSV